MEDRLEILKMRTNAFDYDMKFPLPANKTRQQSICHVLLEHSDDPESLDYLIDARGCEPTSVKESTPLHLAAYFHRPKCIKMIIDRYSKQNLKHRDAANMTPYLALACRGMSDTFEECLTLLVNAGSNTQVRDWKGRNFDRIFHSKSTKNRYNE